jgi:hypothetical protein
MIAFWFHYNKPASRQQGRNVLTLHYRGACHQIHGVDCYVRLQSRDRKQQPRCVIAGKANSITIEPKTKIAVIR